MYYLLRRETTPKLSNIEHTTAIGKESDNVTCMSRIIGTVIANVFADNAGETFQASLRVVDTRLDKVFEHASNPVWSPELPALPWQDLPGLVDGEAHGRVRLEEPKQQLHHPPVAEEVAAGRLVQLPDPRGTSRLEKGLGKRRLARSLNRS